MSTIWIGLAVAVILALWARSGRKASYPFPPGPKPAFLIGNIRDLTANQLWLRAQQWSQQYGKIVYLHVFGQSLVFLNTTEVAVDLLEKRGAIYSDKPALVMAGELCGCENMVAFTRYGEKSRRQRRLLTQALGVNSIRAYHPLLNAGALELIKHTILDPVDWAGNVRRYAGSLTLLTIYGHRVTSKDDKFLVLAESCVDLLSNRIASTGSIWAVDIFPFLKHLPLWFPGAEFKRNAVVWKAKMQEFVDRPYEEVKQRMRDGTAVPCFCTMLLEDEKDGSVDPQKDFDLRWTANTMYSASIDTTITAISHFILAMTLHPEVLHKAQKEMDSVIGAGRLPTHEDRASLPYLDCIMSECLRWGVPVPLGLPHRLMEDDVYEGNFIPKGSLVFANVWSMLRDEDVYPEPDRFWPERFLAPADEATAKRRDPRQQVFGFGRRRCPGMHLIESSLWIVMAYMVATLDISKATDELGNVIEPEIVFDNAVFRTPKPFKCDMRPRSEQAARIVAQTMEFS